MKQKAHGDVREIPTVVANIVRGIQPKRSVAVLEGKEIMGYIRIGPETVTGLGGVQLMNPLILSCERLRKFAAIYGQYRFRRMEFTLQGNLPTTVGGNIYLGYSRNPDLTITSGVNAPTVISSMENSMSVSVWSTSSFSPRVSTNEWYNVDDDSEEIMKTTQGVLFIAQGGIYNITSFAEIPIYLSYTIEARGQQSQPVNQNGILTFPSCNFTCLSTPINWSVVRVPGETGAFPALQDTTPYFISPQLEIPTASGDLITCSIMGARIVGGIPTNYDLQFYPDLEAFNMSNAVSGLTGNVVAYSRFTLEAVDPAVLSLYTSLGGFPQVKQTSSYSTGRSAYKIPNPWNNPNSNQWF